MKTIFMTLYGPLETDARVLRSIDAALQIGASVIIVTCGTKSGYTISEKVRIINLPIKALGINSFRAFCASCVRNLRAVRTEINLIYLHDYYSTVVGLLLKKYWKGKMIYDAHELIIPMPKQRLTLREKFFVFCEKNLIRHTSLVVQANKERENLFKQKYPFVRTANVLNITKYSIEHNKRVLNRENVILVYQGNMSEDRHLSFFLEAIASMPKYYSLLMIGSGPNLDDYIAVIENKGLQDRVFFTGRLSNSEMMERLKDCSIGIISYPFSNYNNIYCSPNKVFEYAAMSLPFISTGQPFIKEIQKEYGVGRTFIEGNVKSFVDNVEMIIRDYQSYLNTERFLADYSYDQELTKLEDIIINTL